MSGMGRGRGRGAKPKEDVDKAPPPRGGPPPAGATSTGPPASLFKARNADTTTYNRDEMKDLFQPTPCPTNVPKADFVSQNTVKPRFVLDEEKAKPSDKWATPSCFTKPSTTAVEDHDFWSVPEEKPVEVKQETKKLTNLEQELEDTKRQMEEYKRKMEDLERARLEEVEQSKREVEQERKKMEEERQEIERMKASAAQERQRQQDELLALESQRRENDKKIAQEQQLVDEENKQKRLQEEANAAKLAESNKKQREEEERLEQRKLAEERREQERLEEERKEQESIDQAKNQKVEKERKRNEEREKRRKEKEEREQRQREAAEERKKEEEEEAQRKLEMKKKREEERLKEKNRVEAETKKKEEQRAAANQSKPKAVWESSSEDGMDFASLHAGMKTGKLKGKKNISIPPPKQLPKGEVVMPKKVPGKVLELKPKGNASAWGSVAAVKKPLNMKKILAEQLKKEGTDKNNEVASYLNPEKTKKKKQKHRQKINHGSDDDDDDETPVQKEEEVFKVPLGPQVDTEIHQWATTTLRKLAGSKTALDISSVCEVLCLAGTAEELRTCAADALGLMKGASRFVEDLVEKRWPTGSKIQQLKQSVQQKAQQQQGKKSQGKGRRAKSNLNGLVNFGVVAAPSFNAGEIETV